MLFRGGDGLFADAVRAKLPLSAQLRTQSPSDISRLLFGGELKR